MSFLETDLPKVGKRVHRLGLALNFGIEPNGVAAALERGLNYVFWTARDKKMVAPLKAALQRNRERYVIATGPTMGFFGGSFRRSAEKALRELGTDYLDVFHLFWLGVGSSMRDATIDEMLKLKEEGKIRTIAASIHDRPRAGKLAEDSVLDLLMIRYNAAHPGAERDIFPHLEKRRPALVAYTATDWRKLLKRPRGWTDAVPTAADCYRFCLSSPSVDVVLCGPKTEQQLDENLSGVMRGPLSKEEDTWMREFGKVVHG